MAQRRMRIGVIGTNGGTDRWGPTPISQPSLCWQRPTDSQALQVAQLLRQFIQSLNTGTLFHPHFGDAVSLHRTLEAVVRSSATGQ